MGSDHDFVEISISFLKFKVSTILEILIFSFLGVFLMEILFFLHFPYFLPLGVSGGAEPPRQGKRLFTCLGGPGSSPIDSLRKINTKEGF